MANSFCTAMQAKLKHAADKVKTFSLIGNGACVLCRQVSVKLLCDYCQQDLLSFDLASLHYDMLNHPAIAAALGECHCHRILALARYQQPYSTLISGLKFQHKLLFADALAELFATRVLAQSGYAMPQYLVPVPLHLARFCQRKYNQSRELAIALGKLTGVAVNDKLLVRQKATKAQTGLGRASRLRNLSGAFYAQQQGAIKHLALVDDVVTTGATIKAACAALRRRYPDAFIEVWAICITAARA